MPRSCSPQRTSVKDEPLCEALLVACGNEALGL
jgi:hypothetical protein